MPLRAILFIVFFVLLSFQNAFTQTQNYAIFWGDDEIGSLSVSRIQRGAEVNFSFLAEVEFRVLVKYRRKTEYKARFKNDTLMFASSKSIMNDKLKDHQTTKWQNDSYQIFKHPSENSILKRIITKTVSMLYYQEPKGIKSIYAEGQSKFCKIESMGSGKYKLHLDDNKENIYNYRNGQLQEVEVNRSWFDLVFKRID